MIESIYEAILHNKPIFFWGCSNFELTRFLNNLSSNLGLHKASLPKFIYTRRCNNIIGIISPIVFRSYYLEFSLSDKEIKFTEVLIKSRHGKIINLEKEILIWKS